MNYRHAIATCLIACLSVSSLNAQTKFRSSNDDIGFSVGVNVPMYGGIESDATLGLSYGHFYHNGLGYRTGFQYTPSVSDIDNHFGVPLAFAFRTGSKGSNERLQSGMNSAAYAYRDACSYGEVDVTNIFASFLFSLISNIEFTAGITPGYIAGTSSDGGYYYPDGRYVKDWTECNNRFSLSLDAGACFNYSIWRFDVKLIPAFHYLLTNNYTHKTSVGNNNAIVAKDTSQPIRWFFTFSGGLSFRF